MHGKCIICWEEKGDSEIADGIQVGEKMVCRECDLIITDRRLAYQIAEKHLEKLVRLMRIEMATQGVQIYLREAYHNQDSPFMKFNIGQAFGLLAKALNGEDLQGPHYMEPDALPPFEDE